MSSKRSKEIGHGSAGEHTAGRVRKAPKVAVARPAEPRRPRPVSNRIWRYEIDAATASVLCS
jgi:hypothetical protein